MLASYCLHDGILTLGTELLSSFVHEWLFPGAKDLHDTHIGFGLSCKARDYFAFDYRFLRLGVDDAGEDGGAVTTK